MFHVKHSTIVVHAIPSPRPHLSLAIEWLGRRAVIEARLGGRNGCGPKTARPATFHPVRSAWEASAVRLPLRETSPAQAPFEVLVQHAPVVVPAGEPLDGTSPDSGPVTRHRRRRSFSDFERLRKQFPREGREQDRSGFGDVDKLRGIFLEAIEIVQEHIACCACFALPTEGGRENERRGEATGEGYEALHPIQSPLGELVETRTTRSFAAMGLSTIDVTSMFHVNHLPIQNCENTTSRISSTSTSPVIPPSEYDARRRNSARTSSGNRYTLDCCVDLLARFSQQL